MSLLFFFVFVFLLLFFLLFTAVRVSIIKNDLQTTSTELDPSIIDWRGNLFFSGTRGGGPGGGGGEEGETVVNRLRDGGVRA